MRRQTWIGAVLLALLVGGWTWAGEPACCEPGPGLLHKVGPAGGWNPYGGGLLHWWKPCCFPRCGAPDDYCRKKMPYPCWHGYPPWYVWGPPESCCPPGNCCGSARDPR